jgi:ABC-type glycerol-3-phosphate transport system substrate-binding protein
MKKLLSMIMVAAMFSLVACGPSEEEKAAAQAEAEAAVNELMNTLEEAPAEEATAEAEAPAEEAKTEEAAH